MEEAQTIPLGLLIVGCFLLLPILGFSVILLVRRSRSLRSLAPAILLAATTTSLLTTCFGISNSTMPIRPYETQAFPWFTVLKSILLLLYVGFGIGAVLASLLAIPASLAVKWIGRRTERPQPPPVPDLGPNDD